ncbi:hypothetical protein ACN47E_009727 [Coniothyrium glycines]
MDHQVQGLTLINNEWVSRPLDIYHIMAHARQGDTEMREAASKPTHQVPRYGILSQTVLSSPLTKYILSANIRHKDLTDIVLVGDQSVHLKEIRDHGHLWHVSTKSDFKDARIIAAKVFGDPRAIPDTSRVNSPLPKMPPLHRARPSMTGNQDYVLPPEVIVLTLSTRTLMFLWAHRQPIGSVAFIQKTIRLPAGASRFDRFGAFLAIDPRRRAMAVAAHEGRLILYKTKSMEAWRSEIHSGKDTVPIEDERIIAFEGRVMHMDFLYSGSQLDEFHVVLLLVLVHQGKTKITCFDWDCREDLDKATVRAERVALDYDDQSPTLLIPMSRSPDFLLVSATHISVYKDILSGVPIRNEVTISSNTLSSLNPGDSKRPPQWTGWDTAPRNPDFAKEVFYIAREDGRIIYAERGPGGYVEVNEAGDWPYRVDTAFTCVSVDNSEFSQIYPDILIAGGAGNDGLLCRVGSWPTEYSYSIQYPGPNSMTFVESMPDWNPLTDLSITRLSAPRVSGERDRCAIFASNGNSPHGRISELRYGLHALIDDSLSGVNGTTRLWVLDHGSHTVALDGKHQRQHHATFALNLPPQTLVIRVVRTQPESHEQYSGAWELGSWDAYQLPMDDEPADDGLMRDDETVSACPWSEIHSIQISRNEARVLHRPSLRLHASLIFDNTILLAASRPGSPMIVIAYREAGDTFLEAIRITQDMTLERARESRSCLACDPTCLEILIIDGAPHVFVCTFDSKISLLNINNFGHLSLLLTTTVGNAISQGSRSLVESVVVLTEKEQQILVCATRDGWLLSARLNPGSHVEYLTWQSVRMGPTSAHVNLSSTNEAVAFVSCGSDFCRIRCNPRSPGLEVDSIWFMSHTNPAFMQASVTAMCQLPFLSTFNVVERNLGGFLFAVAGDQLLFSQLHCDSRWAGNDRICVSEADTWTVPRSIHTGARPTSIAYLGSQRRLVVATMDAKEERPPPNGYRVVQSTLKLLKAYESKSLEGVEVKQESEGEPVNDLLVAQYELEHGERVYSIVDWQFDTHHGKKYSMLIVGTGIHTGPGKVKGRRLIFSTGKGSSRLQLQKESIYEKPVYCVALWSNDTTINIIGDTIWLDTFDSQAGRWIKRATTELPSAGIYASVKQPFVYVSTLSHSHICYEIQERQGKLYFEQIFSDSRERSCTHHLVLDMPHSEHGVGENRLVLLTDKKTSSITSLYHPPSRLSKTASTTIFEACLPRTVIRLQRGDIRPPWRRTSTLSNPRGLQEGVLVDDIVGACSDGTIYAFSILSESAHQLLRLLQNLVELKKTRNPAFQNTVIKQRSAELADILTIGAEGAQDSNIRAHDVDPRLHNRDRGATKHKHVDGDLLVKWLSEEGDLNELVCVGTETNVRVLFEEIAQSISNGWCATLEGDSKTKQNSFADVKNWMDLVLMPIL